MARVKKGIFFSISAVLIVFIFVLSSKLAATRFVGQNKIATTQTRVQVLNEFINDFENVYLERVFYIAGRNALQGLAEFRVCKSSQELPIPCWECSKNDPCGYNREGDPPTVGAQKLCPKVTIPAEGGSPWSLQDDFRTVFLKGIILDNVFDLSGQTSDSWGGLEPTRVFGDGVYDFTDNCLQIKNNDGTGTGDPDYCKYFPNDKDKDGVKDSEDNCPTVSNYDQRLSEDPNVGEACISICPKDADNDGICDSRDKKDDFFDPYNFDYNADDISDKQEFDQGNCDRVSCHDDDIYAWLEEILDEAPCTHKFDPDHTVYALIGKLEETVSVLGLKIINFEVNEQTVMINQTNPYSVTLNVSYEYYFQDKNRVASWKGQNTKEIEIDISGLPDPESGAEIDGSFVDSNCQACESFIGRLMNPEDTSVYDISAGIEICYNNSVPPFPCSP